MFIKFQVDFKMEEVFRKGLRRDERPIDAQELKISPIRTGYGES